MSQSVLSARHFHDEEAAYAYLEAHIWPEGPVCPHCGGVDRIGKMQGKATRIGLYKCYQCRKQFRVTVGTVFESSHVPLHIWLQAVALMSSSKKGISANQLHRTLDVSLKTAWFMGHRIREAMREGKLAPFGGDGGTVEVDETFIGREPGMPVRRGYQHKMKVLSLIDREKGKARSVVIGDLTAKTVMPILRENIAKETLVMTDDAGQYESVCEDFEAHGAVRHSQGEYVVGQDFHTNTAEGYFSVFKRGMKGIYQHCAKHHLHRYLAEFDFRYNHRIALGVDDIERTSQALRGIVGKRLTYRAADRPEVS
jgi:transposase-like protein